jgi:hypothetical protein
MKARSEVMFTGISLISENILRRVSMNEIKKKRKENFSIYFKAFAEITCCVLKIYPTKLRLHILYFWKKR